MRETDQSPVGFATAFGAGGEVVAFDLDTRFFSDEPGIEARQGDILSDDVERDAYDLVHCRALLHHLPGRQHEALQRMVSALRPGGVMVATEPWLGAMWASPTDVYARASKAVDVAIPADYGWAVGLAQAFRDAGLVVIRADAASDVVQGATALAELVALTIEAVRPVVPIDVDIDSAINLLEDPDTFEPGPVWYLGHWNTSVGLSCEDLVVDKAGCPQIGLKAHAVAHPPGRRCTPGSPCAARLPIGSLLPQQCSRRLREIAGDEHTRSSGTLVAKREVRTRSPMNIARHWSDEASPNCRTRPSRRPIARGKCHGSPDLEAARLRPILGAPYRSPSAEFEGATKRWPDDAWRSEDAVECPPVIRT